MIIWLLYSSQEIINLLVDLNVFELKYLTVRDLVKKGDITVEHIDTESMLADPLTKSLRPICFAKHVENMGVLSSFDVLG